MKKLTTSVLAVVLTSSFSLVNAQQDSVKTQDIEGVVVTALGIKREEKSLPYATQQIKAKDLNVTQNVDVKNAIVGKVSGVQLNGQAGSKLGDTGKLRIRGAVGLRTDSDALYVLDGVVIDPNTIDMDIVESVNVLKGPNATALYGLRAVNGVVVMTTKRGAKNRFNVELNSTTNVDMVARTMRFQNQYGQGYEGNASFGTFEYIPGFHPAEWAVFDGKRYLTGDNNYADESWGPKLDGEDYIPWYAWWKDSPYFGQTAKYSPQPNNVKDFYDDALTFKNTVSVSGGNDMYTARLAFTNLNQSGIMPYTGLKRNYLNLNANFNFSEKFSAEATFNFSNGKITGDFDDGYGNQTTGTFNSWFGRDIDINKLRELRDLETPLGYHANWNWWGPDYYPYGLAGGANAFMVKPAFWINPYTWLQRFDNTTTRNTLLLSVAPSYKITRDLTARAQFSRANNNSNNQYFMPYSLAKNGSGVGSNTPGGYFTLLNGFGVNDSSYTEDTYDGRLSYQKKISDIDLNVVLGGNIINRLWNGFQANMDYTGTTQWLVIPDVYDFSNTNIPIKPDPYRYKQQYRTLYSTLNAGYKDIFYLDLSASNIINSAFLNGKNSNFSYSVGGSVLLHNLFAKNDALTFFKIRGGFAQIPSDLNVLTTSPQYRTGNQPLPIGSSLYPIVNLPTSRVSPDLTPAINVNKEFGVDLKFIKNRLSFSATYFDEDRNDEPIPVSMASSAGAQSIIINSASANRKGFELNLSGDVFRNTDGFNWTTSVNWSNPKSTITKVNETLDRIALPTQAGFGAFGYVQVLQMPGYEWGQLYGTGFKTDANGNKVLVQNTNGDWVYDIQTDKAFGSVLPKFIGGFYNSFSYKGLTLAATIDFQKGGKFFSLSEQWGTSGGLLEATAAMNDRGHNVRDDVADGGGVHVVGVDASGATVDTYVDAHTYFTQFHGNRLAEPFIHDASYVKLREVALSYQLPRTIFSGTGIQDISIGLVARNPWLISVSKDNTHKMDPSEMSQNYGEDGQLPSTRGFGVNFKINF